MRSRKSNMSQQKLLLLCYIILSCLMAIESVKIGISKPLGTTTNMAPNVTTIEATLNEEHENQTEIDIEVSTTTAPKTIDVTTPNTTIKTTTPEPEWPEFPPRKQTTIKLTTTTTRKPTTTTSKKSKSTTPRPASTTEAPEIKNITDIPLPETLGLSAVAPGSQQRYCFCDLTNKICDINCCCDPDCTPEALKVFRCLKELTNDFELHEGRFEDFKFQHGLPSCEVNDGWLCVFRTYIPPASERVRNHVRSNDHNYNYVCLFFY